MRAPCLLLCPLVDGAVLPQFARRDLLARLAVAEGLAPILQCHPGNGPVVVVRDVDVALAGLVGRTVLGQLWVVQLDRSDLTEDQRHVVQAWRNARGADHAGFRSATWRDWRPLAAARGLGGIWDTAGSWPTTSELTRG